MSIDNEIAKREKEEAIDVPETVMPPEDIIAFTESRSCADLFRLHKKGQLEIQPEFQRGIVWSNKDQSLFVDSLIKQLPIPSLCISLDVSSQKRLVIDGLQRIWSIVRFLDYEAHDWTIAQSLDLDARISGKKVSYLARHEPILFDKLENLTIPITVIRCDYSRSLHMAYLFQIFRRLNSGGRKLLNQEIRNCVYQGPLNLFLRDMVRTPEWMNATHATREKIERARFGHEERILRFLAMHKNWRNYTGNLSSFLNKFMDEYREAPNCILGRWRSLLEQTLSVVNRINLADNLRKNKNLFEGMLLGIAANIQALEKASSEELTRKTNSLLQTRPYGEDAREGMAHTTKVKERIEKAIEIFGE